MKKNKKYDFIIYTCLIGALFFITIGSTDYINDIQNGNFSFSKKEQPTSTNKTIIEEPEYLKSIDKNKLVKDYIISIREETKYDESLPVSMINTWGEFEIINTRFIKEIASDYYQYKTEIIINNKDANIPISINEELSTDEYIVITLQANILYSSTEQAYIVKKIDLINEN